MKVIRKGRIYNQSKAKQTSQSEQKKLTKMIIAGKALYPIFFSSDAQWNGNHNDWETFYENLELITWYNKVTK